MKKSRNSNARDEEISQNSHKKLANPLSYFLTLSRWINAVEMVVDNVSQLKLAHLIKS